MSTRITAGNDAPFMWAVKVQGQPFDLSGKDVKVYVINDRGAIPVADLTVEGNEVSGVFEGRFQTRLGEHSLALRINEGRPEMKTAAVANVFELVQWSADAGGSNEGDVIVAPVLIESELSIGTGGGEGGSYDDTDLWKAVAELEKIDSEIRESVSALEQSDAEQSQKLTELSAEVSELSEKVDNLPSAEDEILKVKYGETPFQDIYDAYYAGKYIVFEYANNVFHINRVTDTDIYFVSINGTIGYRVGLTNKNAWYQGVYHNEQSTNKVTTLSESSTDTQYPSAKAVYEALQNVEGGSSVFEAIYGETTYDEIVEARNAGKMVICQRGYDVTILTQLSDTRANFGALIAKQLIRLSCVKGGSWSYEMNDAAHSLTTLDNGNAQITIAGKTAEVATPQYVENLLGTIINGDY